MSIKDSVVKTAATGISATAGSDSTLLSLTDDGKIHIAQLGSGSYLTSTVAQFGVTRASVNTTAPNGFTQNRNELTIKVPRVLSNGRTTVDTIRIKLSVDVETTAAEIDEMRYLGSQCLGGAAYDSYWNNQSLS